MASLTGIISAVLVLKGRENLLDLPGGWRWTVIGLLTGGFRALVVASRLTVSAVHGPPGHTRTLDAQQVLDYEASRARAIRRMIDWVRRLALAGVPAIAAAVVLTWTAPDPQAVKTAVPVTAHSAST